MLTEREAAERAYALIRARGIAVMGLQSVRKVPAAQLPPSFAARGDVWAVNFTQPTVPGERAADGDVVHVRVYDSTGEAELVLSK